MGFVRRWEGPGQSFIEPPADERPNEYEQEWDVEFEDLLLLMSRLVFVC